MRHPPITLAASLATTLAATLALVAAGSLAGCTWSQQMQGRLVPDTVSLADRCAMIMQAAMAFADIDLGDRTSQGSADVRTIVARVSGTRGDIPEGGPGERNLAVECTFTDNVLTAFRWTKGGPPPSPRSEPPK
jgi:hypothetical protein